MHESDRDLHRFLHCSDSGEIVDCRMTRVTFGITSSPFLASQVLHQLAAEYEHQYPKAAQAVRSSFYVDDVLIGADSIEDASALKKELNELLVEGRMVLRKWRTSHPTLLNTIPTKLRQVSGLNISPAPMGKPWDYTGIPVKTICTCLFRSFLQQSLPRSDLFLLWWPKSSM